MSLHAIVLVDDAEDTWVAEGGGRRPARPGEALGLDLLAAALREHTDATVTLQETLPDDAGEGTFLLLPPHVLTRVLGDGALGDAARRRVVAAGVTPSGVLDLLERDELAAAIGLEALLSWRTAAQAGAREHATLVGRLDVARAMGADVDAEPPFATERYGPLASDEHPTLPALLAAYLRACADAPPAA